jgi:hypothetical protein
LIGEELLSPLCYACISYYCFFTAGCICSERAAISLQPGALTLQGGILPENGSTLIKNVNIQLKGSGVASWPGMTLSIYNYGTGNLFSTALAAAVLVSVKISLWY